MYLLKLDRLSRQDSMLIFHTLARIGYKGLIIVSPAQPLPALAIFRMQRKKLTL
ncbi:MAG: hypothetical protein ACPL28_08555 [bacterium]